MAQTNGIQKFTIFCLETFKNTHKLKGKEALSLFERHGVLSYLEQGYEVLHTQSMEYVVSEIDQFLKNRK